MATIRMASLWQDPRTGIWTLRKRIPARFKAVSGHRGDTVKITTGTADRKAAEGELCRVLGRWQDMQAGWERAANVVKLTPETARDLAARWAAWVTEDPGRLSADPGDLRLFAGTAEGAVVDVLGPSRTVARDVREVELLRRYALDAALLAGVTVSEDTLETLGTAMRPVVTAAHREAALRAMGITGQGARWEPLQHARKSLPNLPSPQAAITSGPTLTALYEAWAAVAVSKPRTVTETGYTMDQLGAFLGHTEALRVTRDDVRRWRDSTKAGGTTNNTWNNRLSAVRQVFAHAVSNGHFETNPADNSLRLRKNGAVVKRLPYSDADAVRILSATRAEPGPARRWAHWVMAFSGMRVGEVLQLTRHDIRQEGEIWFMAVHEDDEGKSVKTGQRRNVPLHPALIVEGFLEYALSVDGDAPLFPDKGLDAHGNRGGRGWNLVGKWVRKTVGILDENKAPAHGWRHRLIDEMRDAGVPEDARDAIVGHARKTTGAGYGVKGEALSRLYRELCKVGVPAGLHD